MSPRAAGWLWLALYAVAEAAHPEELGQDAAQRLASLQISCRHCTLRRGHQAITLRRKK